MKKQLLTIATLAIIGLSNFVNAQAPNWQWAKSAGGSLTDRAYSVVSDASGNLIVAGYFMSPTITFGAITLTNTNSGNADMFIVKYDQAGNVLWAKSTGGSDWDVATSIAVDASGNLTVAGSFQSASITFGATTLTNAGLYDIFVAEFDSSGTVLWAKSAGGSSDDIPYSVTADAFGNFAVTGFYDSPSITFGTTTYSNSVGSNMFIVKYDPVGTVLWAKAASGTGDAVANSVTTDVSGNIIVTGVFNSPLLFGTFWLPNVGNPDIFIVKYDQAGTVLWAKAAGGSGEDDGHAVVADASGNLIVTGWFYSPTITFGSTTLTNTGGYDIFIVKYDQSGTVLWAKSAGGSDFDFGTSIAVDGSGNSFVTGYYSSSTITFGSTTLSKIGGSDIFIAAFDPLGTVLWAKSAGGNDYDYSYSTTLDVSGNLIFAGSFQSSTITFDATTLTNKSSGDGDMFIAKLNGTTGIAEHQEEETVTIAPNPFSSQTTISFNEEQKNTTIKIMDVLGKEIKVINFSGKQFILEKGTMQSGIYFVQATNDKGIVMIKRILTQ